MVQKERITALNTRPIRHGRYVLYWMQSAQRAEYNHALEYAIERADELDRPVVAIFGLTDDYPEATLRHYHFMLEGLRETQKAFEAKGVRLVIRHQSPEEAAVEFGKEASLVVVDGGQLRIQRKWRADAAKKIKCPLYQVETNLIVPVAEAAVKENFSAGTFRPRINKKLDYYLAGMRHRRPKRDSLGMRFDSFDISDIDRALSRLDIDRSVSEISTFRGGTSEAKKHLKHFIKDKLDLYGDIRNDPNKDGTSNMSPYLHFGQISPLYIALKVPASKGSGKGAYLEELIVRRELSHNFVFYNERYDKYAGLAAWAKRTLNYHAKDKRRYVYSLREFEQAKTHDPYWNAAQKEMMIKGKMHGYMRMYWGKKILEWSRSPMAGFKTAIYLNNRYELDGRDANAYAGIAWCFGQHDRAWAERPVFGKVRYMNANGLKRKFDADAYVEKVRNLEDSWKG
ncbi:MAG TPA: deoxyribodipyrimidine photolyase [Planctomycetes bacterium]|nr:deoxyribodipyrimidine photolyase [Planctomycetota bacterium]